MIQIGLLGFGAMGKTHAYAIENLKYFFSPLPFSAKIRGICTAHQNTAQAAAKIYGFEKIYTSEDEMIADPAIDIIDICTPNCFHYDTICKAIAAGKQIYCEKPLCITAEQAFDVAQRAKVADITAQVVFHNRFLTPVMRSKQLIAEGRLGRIISFRACYLHDSCTDLNKNAGWKQDRSICGGGVLFDLGSHVMDLIYDLCGKFKTVIGRPQIAHPQRKGLHGETWTTNADEAFYMIATMENGAMGTIEASKLAVGTNDELFVEIHGECGALKFDLMDPNWLYFYDKMVPGGDLGGERGYTRIECVGRYPAPGGAFPSGKAPIDRIRGHVHSMYAFLDAVHLHHPASPSFEDAAHIQWAMQQAYQSCGWV